MIVRFRNACAIFFISLRTVLTIDCESRSIALSLDDKADYEQAVSRCIGDSDAYRTSVNGEPRTELEISICELEHYLEALSNSDDGGLQSSNIFKALDQNKNGQLSLCDIIFGAEELKKDFYILGSMFSEHGSDKKERQKKETQTNVVELVKVVDDHCDLSCQVCPESLCIRKDECAYNVHLGCFQTHQPTLTPTDVIPNSEVVSEDPSEVTLTDRSNLTWSNPVQYKPIAVLTASSQRFTKLVVGTSTIIWIVLVVYLIRSRKCKCNLCTCRAPCKIERNMEVQDLLGVGEPGRIGEYSEGGESSGYESHLSYERVYTEGRNLSSITLAGGSSSSFHRTSTTNSEVFLGGSLILDKLEPDASIKHSNRNPFVERPMYSEKLHSQPNTKDPSILYGVMPNPDNSPKPIKTDTRKELNSFLLAEKCQTVGAVSGDEEDPRKGLKTTSSSQEIYEIKNVAPSVSAMEKMPHLVGGSSSSDDDSGY